MTIELLNAEFTTRKIKEKGWTRKWVIAHLDTGQDGYKLLRGEWLPKDPARKAKILRTLAKLLGVEVSQLLLRLETKKTA